MIEDPNNTLNLLYFVHKSYHKPYMIYQLFTYNMMILKILFFWSHMLFIYIGV